jgi:hypothetical protein
MLLDCLHAVVELLEELVGISFRPGRHLNISTVIACRVSAGPELVGVSQAPALRRGRHP